MVMVIYGLTIYSSVVVTKQQQLQQQQYFTYTTSNTLSFLSNSPSRCNNSTIVHSSLSDKNNAQSTATNLIPSFPKLHHQSFLLSSFLGKKQQTTISSAKGYKRLIIPGKIIMKLPFSCYHNKLSDVICYFDSYKYGSTQ